MRKEIIKKLCCPFDKSDLTLWTITEDDEDKVLAGILSCAACNRVYPIVSGIPIMSPDEYRDFKLEQPILKKWKKILNGKQGKQFKTSEGKIKAIK
ncbi:Trm112 family protein [Marixanthomonas spongiae]|uniref:Trm112 family protein n=1 Tax=Marixanthomonas spongiae TaxID=2174845 RepID=A0A2U0HY07_9FLAO|nr:Trm112 family protein [Marixanthomonas spongiae]PVW13761.1 hypothetical protein DDV96_11400 [Marixanthomonas spongiae]